MEESSNRLASESGTDEVISDCVNKLMQINLRPDIPILKLSDIRQEKIEQWKKAKQTGQVGVPFCINGVNKILGGWRERCFAILAGYRGEGKSTLARQDAYYNAMAGRGAVVFSLEDPYDIAGASIVGCHAGLSTFHCDIGDAFDETIEKFDNSWQELNDLPLWIVSASLGINEIVAIAEMLKLRHKISIIYIDHIQYIIPLLLKGHNRNETISYYSNTLSGLAKRLGIPVIALSQLNRSSEQEGRKPRLSDLRDSGSLEQDARQVLMLIRDKENDCHLIQVAKNNYGISGKEVKVWRLDGKHKFSETQPVTKEESEI
jgi:replicative DNA helicase